MAVNIERSRLVSVADLSPFTNPVVPGTDPQRATLLELACLDATCLWTAPSAGI